MEDQVEQAVEIALSGNVDTNLKQQVRIYYEIAWLESRADLLIIVCIGYGLLQSDQGIRRWMASLSFIVYE